MVLLSYIIIDGTVFSVLTALCALWHESWHLITLYVMGKKMSSLYSGSIGISLKTGLLGYRDEIKVCLAGPVASLAAAVLFFFVSRYAYSKEFVFLSVSNLALFLLNTLPVYPLDAGRALFCALCLKYDTKKAAKIIKCISYIFLLPLSCLSVIIFVESGFNLSLIVICIYLLLIVTGVISL